MSPDQCARLVRMIVPAPILPAIIRIVFVPCFLYPGCCDRTDLTVRPRHGRARHDPHELFGRPLPRPGSWTDVLRPGNAGVEDHPLAPTGEPEPDRRTPLCHGRRYHASSAEAEHWSGPAR